MALACQYGTPEIVDLLLEAGASLKPGVSGVFDMPLMNACMHGTPELVDKIMTNAPEQWGELRVCRVDENM